MRREVVELVEAARGLSIHVVPKPENPRNIRIACERAQFPDRLHRVALALAAVDRAGAQALEGTGDPAMDAARLRMAIDGVFRWMRTVGMDIAEPHAIVAAALGAKSKAGSKYKPTPQYAHDGFKRSMKPRPLMKLAPGPGERISIDALRQKALQIQMTETSLGPAAARVR